MRQRHPPGRQHDGDTRTQRGFPRSKAVLAGLAAAFLLLETALRLTGAFYHAPAEPLSPFDQCPDCPRILCVGDSFTYGIGASFGNDYPSQLQRQLNHALPSPPRPGHDTPAGTRDQTDPGPRRGTALVRNAGIPGANTRTVLETLETGLRRFQPHVVIVLIGTNNEMNYLGYRAYLDHRTVNARILAALQHVRTIRLGTYLLTRFRQEHRKTHRRQPGAADTTAMGPAQTYLRWHARSKPDDPLPPAFLAWAGSVAKGNRHEARTRLASAVRSAPDNPHLLWALGEACRDTLDVDAARGWFLKAHQADPTNPLPCYGLGRLAIDREDDPDRALAWFERGIAADPDFGSNYAGAALVTWIHRHKPHQALERLKQCVIADPDNPDCYPDLTALARVLGTSAEIDAFLAEHARTSEAARDYRPWLATDDLTAHITAWIRADLHAIVDRIAASGATPVLMTYPDPQPVNAVITEVAQAGDQPFVPLDRLFQDLMDAGEPREALFVPDGHCNDRGYRVMARRIARLLLERHLVQSPGPPP